MDNSRAPVPEFIREGTGLRIELGGIAETWLRRGLWNGLKTSILKKFPYDRRIREVKNKAFQANLTRSFHDAQLANFGTTDGWEREYMRDTRVGDCVAAFSSLNYNSARY